MNKPERDRARLARLTGVVLTFVAWIAFLSSFFLPAAICIPSVPGGALAAQSGWETFLDTLRLAAEAIGHAFRPRVLLCMLSPLPNGLMLLAPLANLKLKSYTAFYGAALLFSGTSAIWVCWQVYEGLNVGFFVWVGSILAMALASFFVAGGDFMKDGAEAERLLAELKDVSGSL